MQRNFIKLSQHEKINIEKLYIRTCYNYSRILRLTENYEEAIKICNKGIRTCFKFDLMYALGDLYFQKGLILKIKKQNVLAKKSFDKALLVYKLYKNEDLIDLTQKRLNELNNI